jgi:dolichol-phosphate mannosyltransferase
MADPNGGRSGRELSYPATPVDSSSAELRVGFSRARIHAALRRRGNWEQLLKFCAVGATGYVVNLGVYALLVRGFGVHYIAAAVLSFLVAVTNNYTWNRIWTFRDQRGNVAYQGMRFLVISTLALGANLLVLQLLVVAGLDKIGAQAIAIIVVTPVNFVGNKLWSFAPRR